jgi:hypothetical protein
MVRLEEIGQVRKINDLNGNRTRDLKQQHCRVAQNFTVTQAGA